MSSQGPRVVLADDHAEVLHEVQALLEPEFQIVSAVRDGSLLIQSARESRPDLVICDFRMAGTSGIDACRQVLQAGHCRAAVLLTMYNDMQLVTWALQAGILGYVLKVDAAEELIPAAHKVLAGSVYLSRGVRRNLVSGT